MESFNFKGNRETNGAPQVDKEYFDQEDAEWDEILADQPDDADDDSIEGDDDILDALLDKELEEKPTQDKRRRKGDHHNPAQIAADPAKLTGFQRRFCTNYCYYLDGKQAYYKAGGTATGAGASVSVHNLMKNPKVRNFIRRRLRARDEAVGMLGIDGYSAAYRMQMLVEGSLALFLNEKGQIDLSTPTAQANLDLLSHIKQEVLPNGVVKTDIKLYDVQHAAKSILQAVGVFSEQVRTRKAKEQVREKSKALRFADIKSATSNGEAKK